MNREEFMDLLEVKINIMQSTGYEVGGELLRSIGIPGAEPGWKLTVYIEHHKDFTFYGPDDECVEIQYFQLFASTHINFKFYQDQFIECLQLSGLKAEDVLLALDKFIIEET